MTGKLAAKKLKNIEVLDWIIERMIVARWSRKRSQDCALKFGLSPEAVSWYCREASRMIEMALVGR